MEFSIIGGDKRNIYLKELLEQDKHIVKLHGFGDKDNAGLDEALENNIIIGGLPFSHEGKLFAPFGTTYEANRILTSLREGQLLIAGGINHPNSVDLLKNEVFVQNNALPTAEGIVELAISQTEHTLTASNIMIIGYGRIGAISAKILTAMGAIVWVVENDITLYTKAVTMGYRSIMYGNINKYLSKMDIIINTPPENTLTKENLIYIEKSTLIMDVSSPPYGVCKELEGSLKVIRPRALPGKVAPRSAAKYIRDAVYRLMEHRF